MNPSPPTITRLVSLDVLRVLAVVLVFGAHISPTPAPINPLLNTFTTIWKRGGYVGVDIFFVLSGFLVSGLLFREYQRDHQVDIRSFLGRRGLKLYPSLWFLTIAGVVIRYPVEPYRIVGELLFLQNYLGAIWVHTWSLAVEEHFYLLLATTVALSLRWTSRQNTFQWIPLSFGLLSLFCMGVRIWLGLTIEYDRDVHIIPTHVRLDALMFGACIAYFWHFGTLQSQQWWRVGRWGLILAGALMLLPAFIMEQTDETIWFNALCFTLFYLGGGALLLGTLAFPLNASARWQWIGKIGASSYSIYIWHLPLETLARAYIVKTELFGTASWYVYAVVYLVGSLLFGIFAFRVIELPFMRLRDRWFPSSLIRAQGEVMEVAARKI